MAQATPICPIAYMQGIGRASSDSTGIDSRPEVLARASLSISMRRDRWTRNTPVGERTDGRECAPLLGVPLLRDGDADRRIGLGAFSVRAVHRTADRALSAPSPIRR